MTVPEHHTVLLDRSTSCGVVVIVDGGQVEENRPGDGSGGRGSSGGRPTRDGGSDDRLDGQGLLRDGEGLLLFVVQNLAEDDAVGGKCRSRMVRRSAALAFRVEFALVCFDLTKVVISDGGRRSGL